MADHHYIAVSRGNVSLDTDTDFSYGTTTLADYTAVATAIGVLVADAGSPTQAHVNTLNTAWGVYKTATDLVVTAAAIGDLVLLLKDSASMTRLEVIEALVALEGFLQQPTNIAGTQFPVN